MSCPGRRRARSRCGLLRSSQPPAGPAGVDRGPTPPRAPRPGSACSACPACAACSAARCAAHAASTPGSASVRCARQCSAAEYAACMPGRRLPPLDPVPPTLPTHPTPTPCCAPPLSAPRVAGWQDSRCWAGGSRRCPSHARAPPWSPLASTPTAATPCEPTPAARPPVAKPPGPGQPVALRMGARPAPRVQPHCGCGGAVRHAAALPHPAAARRPWPLPAPAGTAGWCWPQRGWDWR